LCHVASEGTLSHTFFGYSVLLNQVTNKHHSIKNGNMRKNTNEITTKKERDDIQLSGKRKQDREKAQEV